MHFLDHQIATTITTDWESSTKGDLNNINAIKLIAFTIDLIKTGLKEWKEKKANNAINLKTCVQNFSVEMNPKST